ncbi:MAG TPA: methylmalonyl Co-A mutase-associated GTPase MeaB [Bacteroidia bacterium]|nr:methylmalonyl Co-A mutase-associated GTPase MeaB [Bacteroidia bacterium]
MIDDFSHIILIASIHFANHQPIVSFVKRMAAETELVRKIKSDRQALARCISIVENESEGWEEILQSLPASSVPVIGITGPPGAGKSTLINNLIQHYSSSGKKVAVLAVDPTSPFTRGSLLGDRLHMAMHFNNENVFIRSVATRGSLGGLTDKALEITDAMKSAGFDLVLVETVGVGQSETEIASLADATVLVLVPESGDEIQTLKSGVMEIADIYVVNKSDHEDAEKFSSSLAWMVQHKKNAGWLPPVVSCIATQDKGTVELAEKINLFLSSSQNTKKVALLTEKAFRIIAKERMKDVTRTAISEMLREKMKEKDFNLYRFVKEVSK